MSLRSFVLLCLAVGLLAGGGLAALVLRTQPSTPLKVGALLLAVLAVGGLSTPLWFRVQQRITPKLALTDLQRIALRQGSWAGLYVAAIMFLRVNRLLDWALALVLLVLFVMLETFLQQRRQWRQLAAAGPPAKGKAAATSFRRSAKKPPASKKPAGKGQKSEGRGRKS